MSLTSLIKGEFKDFFKEIIPTKKEFKTFSGTRAFSKDYIEHVEYKLENPYNSGVIGTAFDYLARWLIAKNINGEKKDAYSNLVAQNGIKYCEIIAQQNKKGSIRKRYDNGINCVELFVNGSNNKVQTIKTAIFFAKLDRIWRSGTHIIDIEKLLEVEEEVFTDLVALIDVFQTKFIDSGVVTETSIVVYNPSFGGASYLCGGADADIYIDGTLYDFKCTKKVGYVWNEVAQILGYYLLDNISKGNNDPTNDLGECEIKRIAFYKARFGEIEYYDVSKENYLNAIEQLAEMLGKDKYREYFDKIKKREEEDRKRRAFEEEYKNVERIHRKLLKYTKSEFFFNHLKKCNDSTECLETMKIHIEVCYNIRIQDKIDGKKLRKKMESKGIDIETLCRKIGRKPSTIRNWLEEKNNPTAGALIDLTEIFSCSISELIKGEETSATLKKGKKKKRNKRKKK